MVAMVSMMTMMSMMKFTVTMVNMSSNYMIMPCVMPSIIITIILLSISSCGRPFAIASIVTVQTMDTVFIDISLAIVPTIAWHGRPLTIAIVAMKSLNSVIIASSMTIAIVRISRPFAVATIVMMSTVSMMSVNTINSPIN